MPVLAAGKLCGDLYMMDSIIPMVARRTFELSNSIQLLDSIYLLSMLFKITDNNLGLEKNTPFLCI